MVNKILKIAHLTCVFPPQQGGIGFVVKKYTQIATKIATQIFIYTPNYKNNKEIRDKKNNFSIYRVTSKLRIGNAAYINIKKYLKDINILHIHYPFYGSVIPSLLNAKKYKIKTVVSWHMNPQGKGLKGLFFKLYEKLITPWIFQNVDQILVSTTDYFQDHFLFKKFKNKILELAFSVDLKKFRVQEKDTQLIQKYDLKNKKILLFVGGLDKAHYFKGVNLLIKALTKLDKQYSLLIIGEGNLKNNYQQLVKKLNLNKRVVFINRVDNQDLIKYYNLADCLILPSINQGEAFGIVQIEAMACATPVIVSNLPGVRKVPQNNKTGFTFETQNINDLIKKIETLFADNTRYKTFSQNARRRVIEKFSDQIILEKLIKIYQNL